MDKKSHVDLSKLNRIYQGQSFEYRDVVEENFPTNQHSEDGAIFKREVESGSYDKVIIDDPDATHIVYKKL